ncbi:MAG: hypothetical protein C0594_14390 [Marinilabiliales bacterium]|nr:MAG: hypothetical protein C0594_14390 [Marinilabiliales bacterium]
MIKKIKYMLIMEKLPSLQRFIKMKKVTVQWSTRIMNDKETITKSKSKYLDLEEAVYMYVCAYKTRQGGIVFFPKRPIYIGKSYKRQNDETVRDRILEHFNDDTGKCIMKKCTKNSYVKVGKIILEEIQQISPKVIQYVECCLINNNQPLCNDKPCKISYTGYDLQVTNIGSYKPLKEESLCFRN